MFNVCPNRGHYRAAKLIDACGPSAICPVCLYAHPFHYGPLFILTRASGAGKSSVVLELTGTLRGVIVLDSDILWTEEFASSEKWPRYFNLWLRLCKNIAQSGQPVLLSGAGLGVPENLLPCEEARSFSRIHFLALICDDITLARRLHARPEWRQCDPAFVDDQIRFNRWFCDQGKRQESPIRIFDTTKTTSLDTAAYVRQWVATRLSGREKIAYCTKDHKRR